MTKRQKRRNRDKAAAKACKDKTEFVIAKALIDQHGPQVTRDYVLYHARAMRIMITFNDPGVRTIYEIDRK